VRDKDRKRTCGEMEDKSGPVRQRNGFFLCSLSNFISGFVAIGNGTEMHGWNGMGLDGLARSVAMTAGKTVGTYSPS